MRGSFPGGSRKRLRGLQKKKNPRDLKKERKMRQKKKRKAKCKNALLAYLAATTFPVLPERESPSGVEHSSTLHSLAPALLLLLNAAATRSPGALVVEVVVVLVVLALVSFSNRCDPDREPRLAAAAAGAAPAA